MTSIRTEPVAGPSVWRREDVEDPAEWTYELSGAMRAEVSRAAEKLTEDGTVGTATVEDVDLPLVGPLVKQLVDQLEHGRGLVLLKGVPIDGLTLPEAHAVYWALGTHLGTSVAQNGRGEKIVSIRDHGIGKLSSKTVRGYQTNESLPFHSDAPDLAALLCLRQAQVGGVFSVASAHPGVTDDGSRRHLLRLWINVHDGRTFPTFMSTHRWGMQQAATVAAGAAAGG